MRRLAEMAWRSSARCSPLARRRLARARRRRRCAADAPAASAASVSLGGRGHRPAARRGARHHPAAGRRLDLLAHRSRPSRRLPGGENTPLNQVILQAPGVAQDSFGQLHIRGEHNGLQYRLNGVILPEGLSVFSQALSPRLAGNVELITGALPAEYGLRTAGIIDITTKSGGLDERRRGRRSMAAATATSSRASSTAARPATSTTSSPAATCTTTSASSRRTAAPTRCTTTPSSSRASPTSRTSSTRRAASRLILGDVGPALPDPRTSPACTPDTAALGPRPCNGQTDFPSENLEREPAREHPVRRRQLPAHDRPAHRPGLAVRPLLDPELHARRGRRHPLQRHRPDADKTDMAGGLQAEGVYDLNDAHTLRGGVIVEVDRSTSDTTSQVLARSTTTRPRRLRARLERRAVHHRRQRRQDRRDLQRLPAGRVEARRRT